MNITNEVIKQIYNIEDIHSRKILDYFYVDNKLCNLVSFVQLFNQVGIDDMTILKSKSYSDSFFEYITKKYSVNDNSNSKIFDILNILFTNYLYPLKLNRHELDSTFDHILYFSLYNYKHIYNYCFLF